VLDRIVLLCDRAWISEVGPEKREFIQKVKAIIQGLQSPYVVPLGDQLRNLMDAAAFVAGGIQCYFCYKASMWGMVQKVRVHWLMEQGEYSAAIKLKIEADAKEWFWMILAAWVRLILPKLSRKHISGPEKVEVKAEETAAT
jgi:uncharacterized membrane protein (GlpM family)